MLALSYLEHFRSPRPAIILNAYLFLTILLDIAQTRTLGLASVSFDEIAYSRLFTMAVVVKTLLIILESQQKTRWLSWDTKEHSLEETSGLYSLGAFAWLNKLFLLGYKRTLTLDDLYPLDQAMASNILHTKSATFILKGPQNRKNGLAMSTAKALAIPLLLPVGPRIALTAFQFCQPFLINSLVSYLQIPPEQSSRNDGYGLIGTAALIYTGIAISGAIYWKTLEAKLSAADDSAALTLMSADVERIIQGLLNIHELWANIIEVALASWLLSVQIGASFVAPLIVVGCCVVLTAFLARFAGPRQKTWMERIQKRVGLTSNVIGEMKHFKIAGLVGPVEESIQQMRVDEVKAGARFRMIITWSVIIGYTPMCISPVVTFAFAARTLDTTIIFTSLSYLLLLSNPLVILFQMVPGFSAALTCLTRIQMFLERDSRADFRKSEFMHSKERMTTDHSTACDGAIHSVSAMSISRGNFGWEEDKLTLQDINLDIPASQLTIVIGPIASGKSTLCKVILGEAPFAQGVGSLGKQNIVGFSAFDEERYHEVLEASMLLQDLAVLPLGDLTNVGSKGLTLSGGQKSRVCIARTLYLDSRFLVFDDIFSGLDADTEEQVFRAIFPPTGLLRRRNATAVLCTHSVKHLPSADHIVALGSDGKIVEQGPFLDLMTNDFGYVPRTHHVVVGAETAGLTPKEEPERALGDSTVFRHYFARVKMWITIAMVICSIGWGFFNNFNVIWLKFWSQDVESANPRHSTPFYLGVYAFFQMSSLICLFVDCLAVLVPTTQVAGARIHKEALATVVNAPLKFFTTTTDTGVVTNHFSQYMTLIDGSLPISLLNSSVIVATCIGVAAVIATSSQFLIITYPLLAVILWGIHKFYLHTSRQIRLLDLEAKSPLYTHFIDTIKGLATFRAFGWAEDGIALNNSLLDTSQRPAYFLAMIQRWLGFTLQLVVAGLAVVFVTLATQLRSNSAFTGANLITLMSFGDQLTLLVQQYTLPKTSIGAVSRLKNFSEKVESENLAEEDVVPPREWPLKGGIEIHGLSASYGIKKDGASGELNDRSSDDDDSNSARSAHLAIKEMTLSIAPGEKVAICGSSGSGKSSTVLLLLKLLDPLPSTAQNITIDSTPLHKIDRQTLRQRIIAIPQDPVFLPDGTSFQANLDPFTASTYAECRAVLETVGIWPVIADRGGLAAGLAFDTLSAGQKQLFCLARAVLRARIRARERVAKFGESVAPSGILILDEVSSSVDQDTDHAMQSIICAEFEGYTIVMVSHRLEMVMEFDTMVVMEKGKIIKTGPPKELLKWEEGRFRKLY
ncbi:hypothetical protein EYB26_001936 [Talaromyces marneffei]|uniref:uncharacterized protein n=1 Tax=Talaromyces marneffei TaxID=37727 RepID=UPI0012AA5F0E|nr:uncharacterized protein EYB26_001936 [Talaromyces marneffei]QGA14283.1 hypothetical protein EYB26_001936 [Talaromyces marneffei]